MVARFRTVLDSIGIKNDIHVYDPVQHGFWLWVDRDAATNSAPAADAWQRLVKYLHDNLGGGN
jgi:carboxymethylenebutenolidase